MLEKLELGAVYLGDGRCRFCVWAPRVTEVQVKVLAPRPFTAPLARGGRGYHWGNVNGVAPGSLYLYVLDGEKERPDPASRLQPEGVHGPSQVVERGAFPWTDRCWLGPALEQLVFYELHVGTYAPRGTFEAIIPHLDDLSALGVTALELMPVAQFPGGRNWGYDGVYPFAVQNSYGGPDGLKRLVDACHGRGLAVFLDVVYNHLGPEGNYLGDFGPYFTDRYRTPWGHAFNFDGPDSDEVRRFFLENALQWIKDFHIDGLRLDAVHAIVDQAALPFLDELAGVVHEEAERLGRRVFVIAESDLNNPRLIQPRELGGYGLDGQWNDDYHHALHSLLTEERNGYYQDFGALGQLAKAFQNGYVYTGQYSSFRRRRHGCPSPRRASGFVVYAQNHDQVGNRARGERLSTLISFAGLKLAAAVVILGPFLPLLFMGEEYGETTPFQYFTSHSDPDLAEAVRRGRIDEFAEFMDEDEGVIPDPQDEATFSASRLRHKTSGEGLHGVLREFYRELISLRRELSALARPNLNNQEVLPSVSDGVLFARRWGQDDEVCLVFSLSDREVNLFLPIPPGRWRKRLDAAEDRWAGDGHTAPPALVSTGRVKLTLAPMTCLLYQRTEEARI